MVDRPEKINPQGEHMQDIQALFAQQRAQSSVARTSDLAVRAAVCIYGKNKNITLFNDMNNACKQIVEQMPVYSKRLKEDRKWNPSKRYAFGNDIAEITGICSGIQYAAAEHRTEMLASVRLDEAFVSLWNQAIGRLPYYSEKGRVVETGNKVDKELLLGLIYAFEDQFECIIDKSQLTDSTIDKEYNIALAIAQTTAINSIETERRTQAALSIE